MTLIVLLILAAVSLSAVFSEKGIFNKAETAGAKYNEAKAREVLETVLLADGQYEKNINPEYNQEDFLNELIINEIPGTEIRGDVAIISGWAFELDRSVPKIGRALGKADKLVFPTVNATVDLATDKKNATINITAKEEKNGINKIEIWLLGEKIKEIPYNNEKAEINLPYTATQNGKYTIKVYGELWVSTTVDVTGIMPEIKFEPNGNTNWEKEHSTKIILEKTKEKIKNMKYQWTNSVTSPADNTFIEMCNAGDTITKNKITGTFYLWILIETENGEKVTRRSEGFNFDNEGPNVTLKPSPTSANSFILTAQANDNKSGISRYEFYVDGEKHNPDSVTSEGASYTWTGTGMVMDKNCYVIVYDAVGNQGQAKSEARTLLHNWRIWDTKCTGVGYEVVVADDVTRFRKTINTYKQRTLTDGAGAPRPNKAGTSSVMPNGRFPYRGFYRRSRMALVGRDK